MISPRRIGRPPYHVGLEVERMESCGDEDGQCRGGRVREKVPHPDADKLSLCKVNDQGSMDIVCGARNFQAGDKVALAQIGAVLPGDFRIRLLAKIRGAESWGMLCSEKELGLSDESSGIMVSPDMNWECPIFEALRA